ncbi:uncharacterized protein [Hetaerina americana]|uniref:uncharacterized protein n=1 Tax=Hetaerina americana TaxID=62018 RepID=UPI003A7F624C
MPEKVDDQDIEVQQHEEIIAQQTSQNALTASTSSLLENTVQQLLLSPDIVSVTVLAAPKFPSRHVQIVTVDNVSKEGILLSQAVESGQGMNSTNARQAIQLCQQVPLVNSDIRPNLTNDKLASDIGGNSCLQTSVGGKSEVSNKCVPESIQRRQLLHVFEIPHREAPPQTSAISYFAEKAQSQLLSIVSPSDLESVTGSIMSDHGGGPCMRSLIILPETIVLDPSCPEPKS